MRIFDDILLCHREGVPFTEKLSFLDTDFFCCVLQECGYVRGIAIASAYQSVCKSVVSTQWILTGISTHIQRQLDVLWNKMPYDLHCCVVNIV